MQPVRVLIVDDAEPFRRAAAAVVDLADGFVVVGAVDSGEACLAAAPILEPDLVVMDLGLPGMDGIEAAGRLAALPRPPVVVLVSTDDEEEFTDRSQRCGAVDYITKSAFGVGRLEAAWSRASTGMTTRRSTAPPASS